MMMKTTMQERDNDHHDEDEEMIQVARRGEVDVERAVSNVTS